MVRMSAPLSAFISVRELLALFTTQRFDPLTTAACGLLKRYGPLVLHIIHGTAPLFGITCVTIGETPGGLTVKTYPSPTVMGPGVGRFVWSTTTRTSALDVVDISVTESPALLVTHRSLPLIAAPIGVRRP